MDEDDDCCILSRGTYSIFFLGNNNFHKNYTAPSSDEDPCNAKSEDSSNNVPELEHSVVLLTDKPSSDDAKPPSTGTGDLNTRCFLIYAD
mmetsp:Transcript_38010/g.45916  ORF Transcript_38010/g.45916 Transcript_38010/m.45916 type:complete len:90 (+) Transcript_38010:133-402(+)